MSMTDQEAFNRVVVHLNVQRKAARDDTSMCLYRQPFTIKKCAIGCLIPDEMYDPDMEGAYIEHLIENSEGLPFENVHRGLLSALQEAHDMIPVNGWKTELRYIADKFNLDPGILKIWH